jgi:hypothetical protein
MFLLSTTQLATGTLQGSVSSYDINEQWRVIQQIDVIVGSDDSKKSMPDPMVMGINNFKDNCRMCDVRHVNWP